MAIVKSSFVNQLFGLERVLRWLTVNLCLFWTASGVQLKKRWEMDCRAPGITWTREFTAHMQT